MRRAPFPKFRHKSQNTSRVFSADHMANQNQTIQVLSEQIEKQKVLSGYLLSGPDAERRIAIAKDFARALNCEENRRFQECDCKSCGKIESGNHPDVHWYGIDEDAASFKIETVREFQNWLALNPYEGLTKVLIFNKAHRLTQEAQYALLKSLEEPPPETVLLLLSS